MSNRRWTPEYLDDMLKVGDTEVDPIMSDLVRKHDLEPVNRMMASLVRNAQIVPAQLPDEIQTYLRDTSPLPDWADMDLIKRGETFFNLNWPIVVTVLFCASLPRAYAIPSGARVLNMTKRLVSHVDRRIFETAQFIIDVMADDGLSGGGKGIRSAQKVRLIHTAVRHFIQHDPKWQAHWEPKWGTPINQQDLAGTMLDFSIQVLDGLRRFRIPVDDKEAEGYFHAWKVVGHIIGVDPGLMPSDINEGYELAHTIFRRRQAPSDDGLILTKALIDFMQRQTPGKLFDGLSATIMRHALPRPLANMLQIPRSDWTVVGLWIEEALARLLHRFVADHHLSSKVLSRFGHAVVQEITNIERGGERGIFHVPSSLRERI